jgi:hypothetical protein
MVEAEAGRGIAVEFHSGSNVEPGSFRAQIETADTREQADRWKLVHRSRLWRECDIFDVVARGLQGNQDDLGRCGWLPKNVDVPQADHGPAKIGELFVHSSVTGDVPCDLRVPVRPPTAVRQPVGVTVPPNAIHENCHAPPREGNVG